MEQAQILGKWIFYASAILLGLALTVGLFFEVFDYVAYRMGYRIGIYKTETPGERFSAFVWPMK